MSETREADFYWIFRHYGPPEICEWAETNGGKMKWAKPGFSLAIDDEDLRKAVAEIGPRVQTPAEIAAAIAAARAEGVAIGAANMRERCAGAMQSRGYDAFADALRHVGEHEFPELADADAILRVERAKGAEAMRKWCAREVRRQGHDGLATSIDYADILEVLP